MFRRAPRQLARILTAIALTSVAAGTQDAAEFERGWSRARRLIQDGRWREAHSRLRSLLRAHKHEDYVRAERDALEEDLKRCAFGLRCRAPDPNDLVGGQLLAHDMRTGRIRLRYEGNDWQDFDRDIESGLMRHVASFRGPYSVQLRGSRYPKAGLRLLVCCGKDTGVLVELGHGPFEQSGAILTQPLRVVHRTRGNETVLATRKAPRPKVGRAYEIEVRVTLRSIRVYIDGRREITVRRPAGRLGRLALVSTTGIERLELTGEANMAWLQEKVDAAREAQREQFETDWKSRDELPEWLFEPPSRRPPEIRTLSNDPPGSIGANHRDLLADVREFRLSGDPHRALRILAGRRGQQLPEITRLWLESRLLSELGRPRAALQRCKRVCELDADYARGRLERARLLFELRAFDAGIEQFEGLLSRHADLWDIQREFALRLLQAGLLQKAATVVDRARRYPAVARTFAPLRRMLVMARSGPRFERSFAHETRHFRVVSNIDKDTCVEVARILEESIALFRLHVGRSPKPHPGRSMVYVFAGEAGYRAYLEAILGDVQPHTAGLYDSSLKQLLIRNLPDRAEFRRTVRHEALHQYLDRLAPSSPIWLDEGLAEYFEVVRRENGRTVEGQVRPDNLATLRRAKPVPLREFVHMTGRAFYRHEDLHYAQSWGFVHFLRHSRHRGILDSLLRQLSTGTDTRTALENAFRGTDWARLDRDFAGHLRRL